MQFSTIAEKIQITAASSLAANPGHDPDITGVAAVDQASAGALSYIEGDKFAAFVATSQASALILPQNPALQAKATERGIAWLSTPDPRLAFARAIALFYTPYQPAAGIHPTAIIDPSATCGDNVSVGANAVVQAGVPWGTGSACTRMSWCILVRGWAIAPYCTPTASSTSGCRLAPIAPSTAAR
jgi:UDP-3-O-[3-hydroxymyristoyl] glucosamine N-acyltransferase